GISVAAGRTSGRNFGTRAQHCMGARHLLCGSHSFELEIRLHHPHRFLNPDYNVSDCGRVALGETEVSVTIVAGPSPQWFNWARWTNPPANGREKWQRAPSVPKR